MDERERPIAARVLMIRKESHIFEDELGQMTNEELLNTLFDKRYERYPSQKAEMVERVKHLFGEEAIIDDFISNLTTTVLNGEEEPELKEFRAKCEGDNENPEEVLRVMLETYARNIAIPEMRLSLPAPAA